MIDGYRRLSHEQPGLPGSIGALLRDRGTGARADDVAFRLVDHTTDTLDSATYGELYRRSIHAAVQMRAVGVGAGDSVVLLFESRLEFYYALFGAFLLGAVPVAVYPPIDPRTIDASLAHLGGVIRQISARAVACSQRLFGVAGNAAAAATGSGGSKVPLLVLDGGAEAAPGSIDVVEDAGDRPVLLQYTSGSLSKPKAIELTTPAIFANLRAIGDAFGMREGDVGFSWLPLYHDMGLHSAFFNLIYHMQLVLMSPVEFLRRPVAWLRGVERYAVTHSPAPNFGYSFAARRIRDADIEGLDLSRWRVAMCGAEPIDAGALGRFAERFAPYGFNPAALMAAYGLAENTVAVTMAPPQSGLRSENLDRPALAAEGLATPVLASDAPPAPAQQGVDVVSVGRPLCGHQVRIVGPGGELNDGRVGEIQVAGPSGMLGYRDDARATREAFDGKWLRTGDHGYVRGGELFITGRSKELIIRGGKNYYPHDIEAAATVEGVRSGCVIAFGIRDLQKGTEDVVVVAEVRDLEKAGAASLRDTMRNAVRDAIGLNVAEVVLVPRGVVPKTTSGKLKRLEGQRMYEEGRLRAPEAPSRWLLLRLGAFGVLPVWAQRVLSRLRRLF